MSSLSPIHLRRLDYLVAILIILLAFALRIVVTFDRAYGDPLFAPLPEGSDQRTYVNFAERYQQGTWPDGPFYFQPGFTYYLIATRAITGTSLGEMRLTYCFVGALACGFLIGAGWLLTRRRWGGYLAGLLLAIYPVAIFYSTELLGESLATFYLCVVIFLALWQRERMAIWRSILIGLIIGLCTLGRTNLVLVWLAWAIWLVISGLPRRSIVVHTAVSLIALAAAIAPVTLYNIQAGGGQFQLITGFGGDAIYLANSRESDGVFGETDIREITDQDWIQALWTDIQLQPQRFIELQLRKIGVYLDAAEPGNNIDYSLNGEAVSPLLRAIPLDFRMFAFIGLLGLTVLWFEDQKLGIFFGSLNALIFLGVVVIWVVSRYRLPAIAPLILTSVYLFVWLKDCLLVVRETRRVTIRRLLFASSVLGVVFVGGMGAVSHLPRKYPLATLPNGAIPSNIVFDGTLRLRGWRFHDIWQATKNGWAIPHQSYAVELFWEVLQPTAEDYEMALSFVVDGTRHVGRDLAIGTNSYPQTPTSTWQPGMIYSEIVGFRLRPPLPTGISGTIRLNVYRTDGEPDDPNRPIYPIPTDNGESDVVIQPLAVYDGGQPPVPIEGLAPTDAVFGDLIALREVGIPERGAAGEIVAFNFHWEGLRDIATDYSLFIHIVEAQGNRIAGYDGLVGGAVISSTWMPGYPIYESIPIQLPDTAGTYPVYVGLYNLATLERLSVDAPDNRLLIGEIVVE